MRSVVIALLVVLVTASQLVAAGPKPRVSLELCTKQGLPLTNSQQWFKVLTDLGVSGLRIRAAGPGDEPSIAEPGKARGEYKVVGILGADNVLLLPGGKFNLHDTGRLKKWLDELGDQGPAGVTQPRS